jgi:hypothetical protein
LMSQWYRSAIIAVISVTLGYFVKWPLVALPMIAVFIVILVYQVDSTRSVNRDVQK